MLEEAMTETALLEPVEAERDTVQLQGEPMDLVDLAELEAELMYDAQPEGQLATELQDEKILEESEDAEEG